MISHYQPPHSHQSSLMAGVCSTNEWNYNNRMARKSLLQSGTCQAGVNSCQVELLAAPLPRAPSRGCFSLHELKKFIFRKEMNTRLPACVTSTADHSLVQADLLVRAQTREACTQHRAPFALSKRQDSDSAVCCHWLAGLANAFANGSSACRRHAALFLRERIFCLMLD